MSRRAGYTYISKNRVERPVFHKSKSVPAPPSPGSDAESSNGAQRSTDVEVAKPKTPQPPTPPTDPSPPPPSATPPTPAQPSSSSNGDSARTSPTSTPTQTPPPQQRTCSPPPQYHSSADAYSHGKLPLEPPWTKNVFPYGRDVYGSTPNSPEQYSGMVPWLPPQSAKKSGTLKKDGHSFFGFGRRKSTDSNHTI
ncbi:hypothetical protein FRC02_004667 [Tulasnella sp. 418]|nr:hypothetical protein FRC02_004667 [Tulasnella sp. 418]